MEYVKRSAHTNSGMGLSKAILVVSEFLALASVTVVFKIMFGI